MAKGLRASTERTNRRKLRANVFGPVEKARAERLHAKLLATINSEKPAPPKNKVENEAATEAKDDVEKGSFFLTAPVPQCLSSTSTADSSCDADSSASMRNFCFYLGLCADIDGFTPGDTEMDVDTKVSTKKAHTNQRDQKTKNQRARKPKNSITFPSSRGKGALKPFTGKSRVGKSRK
ncbi:hypothetical protein E8E13_003219 [Curvularia kusanoi]|uniref:DUF2423 domain-containing protein n=1 Tax=Curvularia kusanoi TaxID=90978 RepID=A0A9P4T5G1_CURKU|nr:hypothetical protein E8E13_003219 [Curvularia kusanoi]